MSSTTLMITAATLVGFALADDKSLATLPLALQFLATMLTSIPASLFMGHFGRKAGFMLACVIGMAGASLAIFSIIEGLFWGFCAAAAAIGVFNGFGNYFRFAAADDIDQSKKAKAISYVLAGGVIAAFIGPNLANYAQDLIGSARFAGGFMFVIGMYAMAMLLLSFTKFAPPIDERYDNHGRSLIDIALQPRFITAVICAMLGYGIMSLVMTATPLAMGQNNHSFDDTAFVIQWHVIGMFAPSFFTGNIIRSIGVQKVLWLGVLLMATSLTVNLTGAEYWNFSVALFALGVGWNFLFIGGTTLLTETYRPEERAKTQALNDFLVFSTSSMASFSAGALLHQFGWWWVNVAVIPLVVIIILSLSWLAFGERRQALTIN